MRPPLNAGENSQCADPPCCRGPASMRPPLNAGENAARGRRGGAGARASMRPPLNAGENCTGDVIPCRVWSVLQ